MEKKIEDQLLYDYYGALLTDKQREVMQMYCEDDLGLAEIARLSGSSRQSVYDMIKRSVRQMRETEEALGAMKQTALKDSITAQMRLLAQELIQDGANSEKLGRLTALIDQLEEND